MMGRSYRMTALRAGLVLGALTLAAPAALAQTTANLVVVKDATIRGGSFASHKHGRESILVTRKSDDLEYERRAVLTFDTETTIPAKASIQSATLVLTVKGGNNEVRQLAAYTLPVSFENDEVTWRQRRNSLNWTHAGGDITGSPVSATASSTPGAQVSFNVTSIVQRFVNGDHGSRYTRFLVADAGGTSRDSYREYHSLESSTASARPRLIVTYGGSGSGSGASGSVVSPDGSGNITMTADHVTARAGRWVVENNSGALGGKVIRHPDAGAAKVNNAASSPANYFEMQFHAEAGKPYRIWLRGRADGDHWANDSVFVQFSGSVTKSGSATWRIGTTSATEINLEECSGCGLSGWVWEDNGWWARNALGPEIYFASTGTQTIRVQTREDGLAVDRVVLSPSSFLTTRPTDSGGSTPPPPPSSTGAVAPDASGNLVLTPDHVTASAGKWVIQNNSGALSGKVIRHPDAGAAKVNSASASPRDYFEMRFQAVAGVPYRIWLRGRADGDHWANDSVFVQFSGSVTKSGSATWRIGTTSATEINLEECSGCGLTGWMWEDNGWGGRGVLGPEIYFATTGTHTIRVQTREDGLAVDRIVLSPSTFLTTSPGGSSAPAPAPAPQEPPPSEPPPPSSTSSTLRVLHWNIQHGTTAAGVYNLDLQATWIAKADPHVVSLNEVERFTGWGNEDQPARFAALLKAKTGKTWYYHFASRSGATNAQGNLLLSVYPIESKGSLLLSHNRSVAQIRIMVNGRAVNIFSTHLDADSGSRRATQMEELKKWAAGFPEQRIVAGDFNTWPTAGEIPRMTGTHFDVWAEAAKAGTAVSFSGNNGETRNSRIDYIFLSHGAKSTVIRGARVYDTRDSKGTMASDHRPLLGIFEVR